jgi:hypothetical protein
MYFYFPPIYMTTHNLAIDMARTGDWDKAWQIAQIDEGMGSDVTKDQWINFAIKCIGGRMADDRIFAAHASILAA